MLVESFWLAFPLYLSIFYFGLISTVALVFSLFVFSQYVYILCQKDSTDTNDRTNLFLALGWEKAVIVCATFALLSSLFLLILSLSSIILLGLWSINAIIKVVHVNKIRQKKMERKFRSKLVLIEFLMPYFYFIGILNIF